jgi:hypothetical protein
MPLPESFHGTTIRQRCAVYHIWAADEGERELAEKAAKYAQKHIDRLAHDIFFRVLREWEARHILD